MITVFIEEQKREEAIEFSEGMTVKDALKSCSINGVSVIPVINNEMVLADHTLKKGDRLELLSVVSGG